MMPRNRCRSATICRDRYAPGGFPQNSWKKISKEVLLDADDSLFQLGDAKGEHGLREAIRDYLHHARGVNCRTEQIIVGAGNDYLLMLLSVILGRGHKVAMENPTYISAYRCFAKLGYAMCTISMDEAGMRPAELEKAGRIWRTSCRRTSSRWAWSCR